MFVQYWTLTAGGKSLLHGEWGRAPFTPTWLTSVSYSVFYYLSNSALYLHQNQRSSSLSLFPTPKPSPRATGSILVQVPFHLLCHPWSSSGHHSLLLLDLLILCTAPFHTVHHPGPEWGSPYGHWLSRLPAKAFLELCLTDFNTNSILWSSKPCRMASLISCRPASGSLCLAIHISFLILGCCYGLSCDPAKFLCWSSKPPSVWVVFEGGACGR